MGSGPDERERNAEAAALIEIWMLRTTDCAEIPCPIGENAGLRDDAGIGSWCHPEQSRCSGVARDLQIPAAFIFPRRQP